MWQQSKEGEMGALRAVAMGWHERKEKKILWKKKQKDLVIIQE